MAIIRSPVPAVPIYALPFETRVPPTFTVYGRVSVPVPVEVKANVLSPGDDAVIAKPVFAE
jgi:hypothetical protein